MQEGKHLKKAIFSVNLIVSTPIQKGQRNMTQVKCTKLKPKGKHLDEDVIFFDICISLLYVAT